MMKVHTPNCDFCNEFAGCVENAFDRIYRRDPTSRVLFRSDEFVVVPSLGQVAEGHLLLLPIKHWTAVGDLPESLSEGFTELSKNITAILDEEYGSCITFEHGVRSESAGGCGIDHAHLHVVPLSAALDPIDFLKSQFSYEQIGDLSEIGKQSKGRSGYLFYQDSQSRAYLFDAANLVSQYMRRVLANVLGVHDWDWRSAGKEDRLLRTLDLLAGRFGRVTGRTSHEQFEASSTG
jgi:diadenosine tetraphosphate (Ap4A) HIT family hydrolase